MQLFSETFFRLIDVYWRNVLFMDVLFQFHYIQQVRVYIYIEDVFSAFQFEYIHTITLNEIAK